MFLIHILPFFKNVIFKMVMIIQIVSVLSVIGKDWSSPWTTRNLWYPLSLDDPNYKLKHSSLPHHEQMDVNGSAHGPTAFPCFRLKTLEAPKTTL